jgi:hypothetical protein
MIRIERCSLGGSLLAATALLFSLLVSGCGDESKQSSTGGEAGVGNVAAAKTLPTKGKVRLATAPAKAVFGMIWIDTTKNLEYIYDGAKWVPHDQTVEAFYKSIAAPVVESMTQDEVCLDGDPACTPSGAHGGAGTSPAGHYAFNCSVCHKVGGRLVFDRNGPAYATGRPAPTFDATAKTCSNISCHGVPAGTFSYYFIDGTGEPALNTVNIYGNLAGVTPSWYSTGAAACGACHGNPPRNGTDGSNVWHSGLHGGQGPAGANNQCQLCHPDASGSGGVGTTITNPSMHGNGAINVQATFRTSCFGCH